MLNVPARSDPALAPAYYHAADDNDPVSIAVLDTGVAADFAPNSNEIDETNLTDPKRSSEATDEQGHGTIMCKIISDVAPFARLRVFKVWTEGAANEWDMLAGLLMATKIPSIINVSLSFGLQDVTCSECGHKSNLSRALTHSHASRSTVFENVIRLVVNAGSIVVAAAGNESRNELAYPARFNQALAISSVTSRLKRSSFSNYGTSNSDGQPHQNRFAVPGGETEAPAENIGSFGTDTRNMAGTSHAAAYATGVVAHFWQRAKREERNPMVLIAAMRAATESPDKKAAKFSGYNAAEHGHGIPRL
jgi:subtilisin family serine protease